ncbi:hypothetical protein ACMYR3_16835 (plasmid) [Ampullimonas aquatilis]|uniref:hypothetical protein n=1 Tax=Ampullimonas aquatilis TaxID=1341549 RepID=UPI003C79559E
MTTHQMFSIRLPKAQRWMTYLALIAVVISGIVWWLLHDVLQWGWILAERRLLISHGIAAAATLVIVGGLLPLHIRLAWRIRRNLSSGLAALAIMTLLAATGLLLYYGGEDWRDWVRWAHIGAGLIAALVIPVHVWLGRRRHARSAAPVAAATRSQGHERATALR